MKSISRENEKIPSLIDSVVLSAIAVNFFFQPGRVYSSGATGIPAPDCLALSDRFLGFIPVSLSSYAINLPIMIIAWYQIIISLPFHLITARPWVPSLSICPSSCLSQWPCHERLVGVWLWGQGLVCPSEYLQWGDDIVSLTIRKRTGRTSAKFLSSSMGPSCW